MSLPEALPLQSRKMLYDTWNPRKRKRGIHLTTIIVWCEVYWWGVLENREPIYPMTSSVPKSIKMTQGSDNFWVCGTTTLNQKLGNYMAKRAGVPVALTMSEILYKFTISGNFQTCFLHHRPDCIMPQKNRWILHLPCWVWLEVLRGTLTKLLLTRDHCMYSVPKKTIHSHFKCVKTLV